MSEPINYQTCGWVFTIGNTRYTKAIVEAMTVEEVSTLLDLICQKNRNAIPKPSFENQLFELAVQNIYQDKRIYALENP